MVITSPFWKMTSGPCCCMGQKPRSQSPPKMLDLCSNYSQIMHSPLADPPLLQPSHGHHSSESLQEARTWCICWFLWDWISVVVLSFCHVSFWHNLESPGKRVSMRDRLYQVGPWRSAMISLTDVRRPRPPWVASFPRQMVMGRGNVERALGSMHACTHFCPPLTVGVRWLAVSSQAALPSLLWWMNCEL